MIQNQKNKRCIFASIAYCVIRSYFSGSWKDTTPQARGMFRVQVAGKIWANIQVKKVRLKFEYIRYNDITCIYRKSTKLNSTVTFEFKPTPLNLTVLYP